MIFPGFLAGFRVGGVQGRSLGNPCNGDSGVAPVRAAQLVFFENQGDWVGRLRRQQAAAASDTDGVPVYLRTVSDGLGTSTAASAVAG
jgi:hypothetical protein